MALNIEVWRTLKYATVAAVLGLVMWAAVLLVPEGRQVLAPPGLFFAVATVRESACMFVVASVINALLMRRWIVRARGVLAGAVGAALCVVGVYVLHVVWLVWTWNSHAWYNERVISSYPMERENAISLVVYLALVLPLGSLIATLCFAPICLPLAWGAVVFLRKVFGHDDLPPKAIPERM